MNYLAFFADYFDYSIDYVLGLTNVRRKNNLIKGFDLKILGNNLKEVRIKNSLSQEDMARILNVTQPCITRYRRVLFAYPHQIFIKSLKSLKYLYLSYVVKRSKRRSVYIEYKSSFIFIFLRLLHI